MNRRMFLRLGGTALATEVARRYFDMGAAWRRHESGLLVPAEDDATLLQRLIDEAVAAGRPTLVLPPKDVWHLGPKTVRLPAGLSLACHDDYPTTVFDGEGGCLALVRLYDSSELCRIEVGYAERA